VNVVRHRLNVPGGTADMPVRHLPTASDSRAIREVMADKAFHSIADGDG